MLNYKNLCTRIVSGIVYIAILMLGILVNQSIFIITFSVILIISLNEFYNLINKDRNSFFLTIKIIDIIGGLSLFISSFLYFSNIIQLSLIFISFTAYLLIRFICALYQKEQNYIQSLAYSLLGQIYLSVSFSFINYLIFASSNTTANYNYTFILALFIFIWINDSFAYLVGSLFGRHKMAERISPKKSWEGFLGGAVFTIIASILYSHFYTNLNTVAWIGFGLITVIFGTFGDLIESQFKRTLEIKDSGKIIPGHGGILDRLDSFIFALFAQYIYINLLFLF